MKPICLLWDASALWCLLAWHALRELHLPFQIRQAESIAREGLPDKVSLCVVPGGSARIKAQALEMTGLQSIRHFVEHGGAYLGFCGGAGLGLSIPSKLPEKSPTKSNESLGLCSWHRNSVTDRLQHFINGHMHAHIMPSDLTPSAFTAANNDVLLPVWWPSRFAVPDHPTDVNILATYTKPSQDMAIADMLLESIPVAIQQEWQDVYGVIFAPSIIHGQPCIIHGNYGKGQYILSYSHLETPNSPQANAFLCHIIEHFTGIQSKDTHVPPWTPYTITPKGDEHLTNAFAGMKDLLALGHEHGLLFSRTPWLHGWRAGIPGHGLNTLGLSLAVLAKEPLEPCAARLWNTSLPAFNEIFPRFMQGTASCLLAQRLAASAPDMVQGTQLQERRTALFGSAMHAGGLYQELMLLIEPILFAQCAALIQGENA